MLELVVLDQLPQIVILSVKGGSWSNKCLLHRETSKLPANKYLPACHRLGPTPEVHVCLKRCACPTKIGESTHRRRRTLTLFFLLKWPIFRVLYSSQCLFNRAWMAGIVGRLQWEPTALVLVSGSWPPYRWVPCHKNILDTDPRKTTCWSD